MPTRDHDDVVVRLRGAFHWMNRGRTGPYVTDATPFEAADVIDTLTRENKELQQQLDDAATFMQAHKDTIEALRQETARLRAELGAQEEEP